MSLVSRKSVLSSTVTLFSIMFADNNVYSFAFNYSSRYEVKNTSHESQNLKLYVLQQFNYSILVICKIIEPLASFQSRERKILNRYIQEYFIGKNTRVLYMREHRTIWNHQKARKRIVIVDTEREENIHIRSRHNYVIQKRNTKRLVYHLILIQP